MFFVLKLSDDTKHHVMISIPDNWGSNRRHAIEHAACRNNMLPHIVNWSTMSAISCMREMPTTDNYSVLYIKYSIMAIYLNHSIVADNGVLVQRVQCMEFNIFARELMSLCLTKLMGRADGASSISEEMQKKLYTACQKFVWIYFHGSFSGGYVTYGPQDAVRIYITSDEIYKIAVVNLRKVAEECVTLMQGVGGSCVMLYDGPNYPHFAHRLQFLLNENGLNCTAQAPWDMATNTCMYCHSVFGGNTTLNTLACISRNYQTVDIISGTNQQPLLYRGCIIPYTMTVETTSELTTIIERTSLNEECTPHPYTIKIRNPDKGPIKIFVEFGQSNGALEIVQVTSNQTPVLPQ